MVKMTKTREITHIAIGVATLLIGGLLILQVSMILPIPGVKYIMMAPYMSMTLYILLDKLRTPYALLKIGAVFAGLMTIINVFMGLAILLTTLCTYLTTLIKKDERVRNAIGATFFSVYTGLTALMIPKYLMGGVFANVTWQWILLAAVLCGILGTLGTYLARKLTIYLIKK